MNPPVNAGPSWEVIAAIRETLGRIETKVDFALTQIPLLDAKTAANEAKQYAMETRGASHRADIDAVRAETNLVRQTIEAYDISPAQFKNWKLKVDEVVTAFTNSQLSISVRQNMRKQDFAMLATIAGLAGAFVGTVPTFIRIISGG